MTLTIQLLESKIKENQSRLEALTDTKEEQLSYLIRTQEAIASVRTETNKLQSELKDHWNRLHGQKSTNMPGTQDECSMAKPMDHGAALRGETTKITY